MWTHRMRGRLCRRRRAARSSRQLSSALSLYTGLLQIPMQPTSSGPSSPPPSSSTRPVLLSIPGKSANCCCRHSGCPGMQESPSKTLNRNILCVFAINSCTHSPCIPSRSATRTATTPTLLILSSLKQQAAVPSQGPRTNRAMSLATPSWNTLHVQNTSSQSEPQTPYGR